MSVRDIIQHSLDKNPLAMKEALDEEMKARVAAAIQEKMTASMTEAADEDEEDEDEDEEDEDEDEEDEDEDEDDEDEEDED